jgi:hypothetical protein
MKNMPIISGNPKENTTDPMDDPASVARPPGSMSIEVAGKKTVLRKFNTRDKAGKPVMQIPEPRIRLEQGDQLLVSTTQKESKKDRGDGIIRATGNIQYYAILDHPFNGSAAGYYIQVDDVKTIPMEDFTIPADSNPDPIQAPDPVSPPSSTPKPTTIVKPEVEQGSQVEVVGKKAVLRIFNSRDKAGKPIMEIREPRIRLDKGSRLIVSATHSESVKDKGDGIINATGNIQYYFISDHPSNGKAAGLYVKVADVKRI